MCVLGISLQLPGLGVVPLPTESSCWLFIQVLRIKLRFLYLMADTLLSDLLIPCIIILMLTVWVKADRYQTLNYKQNLYLSNMHEFIILLF